MGRRASAQGFDVGHGTGFGCGNEQGSEKMLGCGVEHRDVRQPNVLWNTEGGKVMLVDFERSEILTQMPIFQEIPSSKKQKHLQTTDGASCSGGPPYQPFIGAIA